MTRNRLHIKEGTINFSDFRINIGDKEETWRRLRNMKVEHLALSEEILEE